MRKLTVWTWFSWIILLALIGYLLAICTACTTINTDIPLFADPNSWKDGMNQDEGPPASINPLLVIFKRHHHTTECDFKKQIEKQVRRLISKGYRVIRSENNPRYILYANDGLNWKRGDISEAVIYYETAE